MSLFGALIGANEVVFSLNPSTHIFTPLITNWKAFATSFHWLACLHMGSAPYDDLLMHHARRKEVHLGARLRRRLKPAYLGDCLPQAASSLSPQLAGFGVKLTAGPVLPGAPSLLKPCPSEP